MLETQRAYEVETSWVKWTWPWLFEVSATYFGHRPFMRLVLVLFVLIVHVVCVHVFVDLYPALGPQARVHDSELS